MLPWSRGAFRIRFSVFDLFWGTAATPLLALYFCDAHILTANGALLVLLYCGISFGRSLAVCGVPVVASPHERRFEGRKRRFDVTREDF